MYSFIVFVLFFFLSQHLSLSESRLRESTVTNMWYHVDNDEDDDHDADLLIFFSFLRTIFILFKRI